MKIECIKDKFLGAVQHAERVTGKNLSLPILKCILLSARDNRLLLKATNLDIGVEIDIPVKVFESGDVAVSGAILSVFLNNLYDSKNVTIESDEGNIKISTPTNTSTIKSLPSEEFPTIPLVSDEKSFKCSPKELIHGFKAVWYSASTSSIKPELSSVCLYGEEEALVFVATDSFRLAEKRVKVKKMKEFGHILIPHKNVVDIVRLLEQAEEEVTVCYDKNQISFSFGRVYVTSRLVNGSFPDYKQIIPKEAKTEVVVLKDDLVRAVKMATIFSDKFNQLSFAIDPAKKDFELRTKNADVGESSQKLEVALSGEAIAVGFNHRYVADCFQSIDSDSVALQLNGQGRPLVMRPVSDKSFTYLVMPMNR